MLRNPPITTTPTHDEQQNAGDREGSETGEQVNKVIKVSRL